MSSNDILFRADFKRAAKLGQRAAKLGIKIRLPKANARSVNLRDSLFSVRKRNLDFYLLNLKKFLIYDIIVKKDFFSRRYKIVSRTKIDSINISFSNFKIYLKNRNFSKFEVMENFQTNIYKNLQ